MLLGFSVRWCWFLWSLSGNFMGFGVGQQWRFVILVWIGGGSAMVVCDLGLDWWWVGGRHGKSVGSGRLIGLRVKTGHFKRVKKGSGQSGCGSGRVELTCIFHMNFFYYKENKIYLPFGKSCNKLLDVKCITLNSLIISKMNYTY